MERDSVVHKQAVHVEEHGDHILVTTIVHVYCGWQPEIIAD